MRLGQLDPLDDRSIAFISFRGSRVSTLPIQVAWAAVDHSDRVASGALWIAPYGPEPDLSRHVYAPSPSRDELAQIGLAAEVVVRRINEALGSFRVELPMLARKPIDLLYLEAGIKPTWILEESRRGGFFAELAIMITETVFFEPRHRSYHALPFVERLPALASDYRSARRAHQQMTTALELQRDTNSADRRRPRSRDQ